MPQYAVRAKTDEESTTRTDWWPRARELITVNEHDVSKTATPAHCALHTHSSYKSADTEQKESSVQMKSAKTDFSENHAWFFCDFVS